MGKRLNVKRLIITITLLFAAHYAFADGSYSDLGAELESVTQLINEEQYDLAIEILENTIVSDPDNASAWNLLGYSARKTGKLQQSAKAYDQALALDPEHKDALEYQGELYLMLGDRAAAEDNLAKLKLLCPGGCEQLEMLMAAIAAKN